MMRNNGHFIYPILLVFVLLNACRKEQEAVPPVVTPVDSAQAISYQGFYLLNEGNMGSNKATLDYYDFSTGNYSKNIYATVNPTAVKELGDVGNDIHVYGGKLYAVINVSNKIDFMEAATSKKIGEIAVPNCRYMTFYKGKAYVSSYAGPVEITPNAPIGFVAEIDTATLQITRKVTVGYQPEEMAIADDKLFVANSGGYMVPNYDSTISVIDLATFTQIKKITVAINLHRLKADQYGDLYVTSRGDYYSNPSRLYAVDAKTYGVKKVFDIAASNLTINNDTAYIIGTTFNYTTFETTVTYNLLNVKTEAVISNSFIKDGTETAIKMPYGIAVNPATSEVYITDARDYVSPGVLYCYSAAGIKKWSVTTGDIPAHFAFLPK